MTKHSNQNIPEMVSEVTGELIDSQEVAKSAISDIDEQIKSLKAHKKAIKKQFKLDGKEVRFQKRFFYKLYKNDYGQIFKDMHPTTIKLLLFFIYNMNHKDNSVVIDKVYPSQEVLIKKSGITKSMYKKALKELSDMNVVKSVRKGRFNKIYIHPALCEDSMTENEIWELFEVDE